MRVANWATGSSRSVIAGPSPGSRVPKSVQQSSGPRTTRGVPCTQIRHQVLWDRAARRFVATRAHVSLKASALPLHVSRGGDSRLAALHEREVSLLALPAR